jgi:formate dehydrogenase maturation protein FdhE
MPAPNAPHPLTRDYDSQLRRAETLSSTHTASQEILAFYSKILSFQKSLLAQLLSSPNSQTQRASRPFAQLRESLDLTRLLPHFRPFLALIKDQAPAPLAAAAHELSILPTDDSIYLLTTYWQTGALPDRPHTDTDPGVFPSHSFTQFFPRAFLHPYAVLLASQSVIPPITPTPNICPLCGSLPLVGILRPEGDGAKRSLLCSFCFTEWNYRRILCPACGETDEPKLPVFIAEQFPHIRTEACDTCRTYLRTIDLSKNGHAIPTVDDLAALPLSLWAHEHNYTRLHPNLLST